MARISPTTRKALADVKTCEADLEAKSRDWLHQLDEAKKAQRLADVLAGERADAKSD